MVLEELLGVTFTPAALLGFDKVLAELTDPLVSDIGTRDILGPNGARLAEGRADGIVG